MLVVGKAIYPLTMCGLLFSLISGKTVIRGDGICEMYGLPRVLITCVPGYLAIMLLRVGSSDFFLYLMCAF